MQDLLFIAPVSDCYPDTRAKLIIHPDAEEYTTWIDTDTAGRCCGADEINAGIRCNIDRKEFLSLLTLARRMGFRQHRESNEF